MLLCTGSCAIHAKLRHLLFGPQRMSGVMSMTKCPVNYSCLSPLTSHPSGLSWPQTGQCGCPDHPWCSDATHRVCAATPASSWHHFLPSLCVMGSELSDRNLPVFKSVKYYVRAFSIKETSTYLIRTQAT